MAGSCVALQVPTAPTFTATAGAADGEIIINVTALPTSWGDATTPGDNAATADELQVWDSVSGWRLFDATPSTGATSIFVNEALYGTSATFRLRGISNVGRVGAYSSQVVPDVPGDVTYLANVVDAGVPVYDGGAPVTDWETV